MDPEEQDKQTSPGDTAPVDPDVARELVKMHYVMGAEINQMMTDGAIPRPEEFAKYIKDKKGVNDTAKEVIRNGVYILAVGALHAAFRELANSKKVSTNILKTIQVLDDLVNKKRK